MFLTAEIWALEAYIGMQPYSEIIATVGKAMLITAAVIVGVLVVAVGLLVAGLAIAAAVIGAVIFGLYQFGVMIYDIGAAIPEAFGNAVKFMGTLGSDMITGLVNGITGGAAAVVTAISDTISGGIKAAKKLLLSDSPSKVFAGLGEGTAQGFVEGVEGGSGDTQGALEAMVAPPTANAGGASRGGGGVNLTIQNINVSGENAKEQAIDFIDQITAWLEGEGIAIGGGEVAHA